MRLLVARCEVRYTGRLSAVRPEAVRLLILKGDGSVLVHDDVGGYKPLNWMTGPSVVEELGDVLVVRKPKTDDVLEIRLAEVLSDVEHDMGESAALQKDGVERDLQLLLAEAPSALGEELTLVKREWATDVGPVDLMCKDDDGGWVAVEIKRIGTIEEVLTDVSHELGIDPGLQKDGVEAHLQELLADAPQWCGEGFRLVRREWPTDIGPVDLMCRDPEDGWVAVEIKRIGTIEAVEQLSRYLERIREDPELHACRGVLAAQVLKPQTRALAASRGIDCVQVDLDVLRGEREPDLQLFAA